MNGNGIQRAEKHGWFLCGWNSRGDAILVLYKHGTHARQFTIVLSPERQ